MVFVLAMSASVSIDLCTLTHGRRWPKRYAITIAKCLMLGRVQLATLVFVVVSIISVFTMKKVRLIANALNHVMFGLE